MKQLLEMTPPKGKTFLSSIMHILERERNWVSPNPYPLENSQVLLDNSTHYAEKFQLY